MTDEEWEKMMEPWSPVAPVEVAPVEVAQVVGQDKQLPPHLNLEPLDDPDWLKKLADQCHQATVWEDAPKAPYDNTSYALAFRLLAKQSANKDSRAGEMYKSILNCWPSIYSARSAVKDGLSIRAALEKYHCIFRPTVCIDRLEQLYAVFYAGQSESLLPEKLISDKSDLTASPPIIIPSTELILWYNHHHTYPKLNSRHYADPEGGRGKSKLTGSEIRGRFWWAHEAVKTYSVPEPVGPPTPWPGHRSPVAEAAVKPLLTPELLRLHEDWSYFELVLKQVKELIRESNTHCTSQADMGEPYCVVEEFISKCPFAFSCAAAYAGEARQHRKHDRPDEHLLQLNKAILSGDHRLAVYKVLSESVVGGRPVYQFPILRDMPNLSFSASCLVEYLIIGYLKSLGAPLNERRGKSRVITNPIATALPLKIRRLFGAALYLNGCYNDKLDAQLPLRGGEPLQQGQSVIKPYHLRRKQN
mgnify:CR=1 FL=1